MKNIRSSFQFEVAGSIVRFPAYMVHSFPGNLKFATMLFGVLALLSAKETGCRKRSDFYTTQPATETRSTVFLKKKLQSHEHPNLKSMNAQASVFAEGNGQSIHATANVIMLRDSVLWISIKKFGLEAARALVTKDSIFILNRLDKTFQAQGMESLQRKYSLPGGFALVQSLLLASPWYFPDIHLESDLKNGLHRLSGSNGRFASEYRIAEGPFWLQQETFLQAREGRSLSASFENYKKTGLAGWFPYLRTLQVSGSDTDDLQLSIELNEVEFNVPKSFRFEIPKHYKRVE